MSNQSLPEQSKQTAIFELIGAGLAMIYAWKTVWASGEPGTLLHVLHLPIHEAGHLIFTPFGEFMHFLGGSLFQVSFPLFFSVYFLRQKQFYAVAFTLLWCGDSLIDVSPYIADAYHQEIALIGGEHDWAFLLGELDLVHRCETIGALVHFKGAVLMFGAVLWALVLALKHGKWIQVKL